MAAKERKDLKGETRIETGCWPRESAKIAEADGNRGEASHGGKSELAAKERKDRERKTEAGPEF
jgi:hypothetical protein